MAPTATEPRPGNPRGPLGRRLVVFTLSGALAGGVVFPIGSILHVMISEFLFYANFTVVDFVRFFGSPENVWHYVRQGAGSFIGGPISGSVFGIISGCLFRIPEQRWDKYWVAIFGATFLGCFVCVVILAVDGEMQLQAIPWFAIGMAYGLSTGLVAGYFGRLFFGRRPTVELNRK